MRTPNIVLIEDDANQREALHTWLELDGFQVWSVASAEAFYKLAAVQQFDLAIVDLGLPGENGLELIDYLQCHLELIILVLTARTGAEDRIKAADLMVNHYLVKPVLPQDLSTIIRAEWERKQLKTTQGGIYHWKLDLASRTLLTPCNKAIRLTSSEAVILNCLINQSGPVYKKEIVLHLGGHPEQYDLHRLDVHLSRLRAKVKKLTVSSLEIMALPGQRLQLLTDICSS